MQRSSSVSLLLALLLMFPFFQTEACTTFCFRDKDHLIFAKNFDFYVGDGHIVVNKRSVTKTSFPLPGERPISWTSKYGSVTFNQLGREFPFGGMNEKGLVVEQMYLADAGYPDADGRAGVAELQWLQYQLDNAATVDEVLATDKILRISKYSAPIHFLICDAKGNVASFEYVDGKTVVRKNAELSVCALTNDTYNLALGNYQNAQQKAEDQLTTSSYDRFAKTGMMLNRFESGRAIDYSFDMLRAVAQPDGTRWSIVYDVKRMTIYIQTEKNPMRRSIRVGDFNFACSAPVMFVDVDAPVRDVKDFRVYDPRENASMVMRIFDILSHQSLFANLVPNQEEREAVANYPGTTTCSKGQ